VSYGSAHQSSTLYTRQFKALLGVCHDLDEIATWLAQNHKHGPRLGYPGSIRTLLNVMQLLIDQGVADNPFTDKGLKLQSEAILHEWEQENDV
jgi:hypothetical protein